jgi:hypothetical protein
MKAGDMSMLTESILSGGQPWSSGKASQLWDDLGIAPLGEEQHAPLGGIGSQSHIVVTAGTRGLVNGQRARR